MGFQLNCGVSFYGQLICNMELVPPFVPPLVDHTRYFRHAPARLRVDANVCGFARGYAAVCLLRPLWSA